MEHSWRQDMLSIFQVGHPLDENDLKRLGIWQEGDSLREKLFKSSERKDCILMQGGAFVFKDYAFPLLGVGAMDYLEPLSELRTIDGIIGTGNVLFIDKNFENVYSALSESETLKRYEIDKTNHPFKWIEKSKIGPLIIFNRALKDYNEFYRIKEKKKKKIIYDMGHSFFIQPHKINNRYRERLAKTATVAHCIAHYTLSKKELIFDSQNKVNEAFKHFNGYLMLGYMVYSNKLLHSMSIENNYRLGLKDNSYPITAYVIFKLVQEFYENNKNLDKNKWIR